MNYNEVTNLWGRKLLTDAGYALKEDETITVDLDYEYGGGCSTCSYTYGVVRIRSSRGATLDLETYSFSEAMNELIKISSDGAINN